MEKRPRNKARNVSPFYFVNLFIFPRIALPLGSHRSIELDG